MPESAAGSARPLRRRTLLQTGIGAAAVAAAGGEFLVSASARADTIPVATSFDFIIDCAGWGARPPGGTQSMSTGTTEKIIVHHTAFPNTTDYSRAQAVALAQEIQNLHMDTNGWSDTGQHFTVSRGGYVLEGRHRSLEGLEAGTEQVIAAHCPGENTRAIGIENEGTYTTQTPPPALLGSLAQLGTLTCRQYGLRAHHVFGHWDHRETGCPGIAFDRLFPQLRRTIAVALGTRLADVPARTWPNLKYGETGRGVAIAQNLLRAQGYPDLTADGNYTAATLAAVQGWQSGQGLPVASDGTLSTATWASLVLRLATGATGDPVTGLQSMLSTKGYEVTVTGTFDTGTAAAVSQVQALHGLPATGRVDTSTWCAVLGGVVREEFVAVLA